MQPRNLLEGMFRRVFAAFKSLPQLRAISFFFPYSNTRAPGSDPTPEGANSTWALGRGTVARSCQSPETAHFRANSGGEPAGHFETPPPSGWDSGLQDQSLLHWRPWSGRPASEIAKETLELYASLPFVDQWHCADCGKSVGNRLHFQCRTCLSCWHKA
eukprot:EG_transcript_29051